MVLARLAVRIPFRKVSEDVYLDLIEGSYRSRTTRVGLSFLTSRSRKYPVVLLSFSSTHLECSAISSSARLAFPGFSLTMAMISVWRDMASL